MFNIGQEVECICDDWYPNGKPSWAPLTWPKKGDVLKIAGIKPPGIFIHPDHNNDYLYFSEHGIDNGFSCKYFRPLQKKKIEEILAVKAPRDSEKWDNRQKIKEKADV